MPTAAEKIVAEFVGFFRPPDLPDAVRPTFRLHLAYAVLDAAAGGILMNAPLVARRMFAAETWQLPLRELLSGVGMIAALYLGGWMASRRKMPFVFIPGLACAACAMSMALATGSALGFLTMFGVSAVFEIVTRPAITAILRLNYPATHRGLATGEVRKWSSLSFVAATVAASVVLEYVRPGSVATIQALIVTAGALSLASFLSFRQIRVQEDANALRRDLRPEVTAQFRHAFAIVAGDRRYRRYLAVCFLDGFFGALYFPLLWQFFQDPLGYGYVGCAVLMHALPSLTAFALTGWVGRRLDRVNPWLAWAWIRFGWGLDALLLAATPAYAVAMPLALVLMPVVGRLVRGGLQGGQWVLWWQVGVAYFAPPGADTSRYMGVMVFLFGVVRLTASAASMALAAVFLAATPGVLLIVGGLGMILCGLYSLWHGLHEQRREHLATIAEFEAQFADAERL